MPLTHRKRRFELVQSSFLKPNINKHLRKFDNLDLRHARGDVGRSNGINSYGLRKIFKQLRTSIQTYKTRIRSEVRSSLEHRCRRSLWLSCFVLSWKPYVHVHGRQYRLHMLESSTVIIGKLFSLVLTW